MPALAKCRLSHASSLDEFDPESWEPEPQSDSDEDFTPSKKPAKRARSSATKRKSTCNPSGQRTTTYSSTPSARNGTSNAVLAKTDLQALSKAELVSQYLALQDQLRQAEKKAGRATPQQIEEQARKLRSLLDSGIQTLMTVRKPSSDRTNSGVLTPITVEALLQLGQRKVQLRGHGVMPRNILPRLRHPARCALQRDGTPRVMWAFDVVAF